MTVICGVPTHISGILDSLAMLFTTILFNLTGPIFFFQENRQVKTLHTRCHNDSLVGKDKG